MHDFPRIPKLFIRRTLAHFQGFYPPAFLYLRSEQSKAADKRAFVEKKTEGKGKGKAIALEDLNQELAEDVRTLGTLQSPITTTTTSYVPLKRRRAQVRYVRQYLEDEDSRVSLTAGDHDAVDGALHDDNEVSCELDIECGCCYGNYPFVSAFQHLHELVRGRNLYQQCRTK